MRVPAQRGLQFGACGAEIAAQLKRNPQNGMRQLVSHRILYRSGDSGAAPCVVQGCLEASGAQMEHIERTEQPQLIEGVAAFLRDREASVQRLARRVLSSAREHQGYAEGRQKAHFLEPAARSIVESMTRPLRPAMTFCQQRHRQKNGRGGHGKFDADFSIAIGAETPVQRRADIVETGKVRRALSAGGQGRPFDPALLQPPPVVSRVAHGQIRRARRHRGSFPGRKPASCPGAGSASSLRLDWSRPSTWRRGCRSRQKRAPDRPLRWRRRPAPHRA